MNEGVQGCTSNVEFAPRFRASAVTFRLEYLARMQSRFSSGQAYCLVDDPASGRTISNCAARVEDYWQLINETPETHTSHETPMDALNMALDSVLIHEASHLLPAT